MAGSWVQAAHEALLSLLNVFLRLALPLAILVGLALAGWVVALALGKEVRLPSSLTLNRLPGYAAALLVFLVGWAALSKTPEVVRDQLDWKESAEATANPTPDAPPIFQYGPVAAALIEKTYTRNLTLPPDFLQRLGAEGIGVLAPYLSDPSAESVIRLVDTFRRSGQDAIFTREVTRVEEQPFAFSRAEVKVDFTPLSGRAYDARFQGRYTFKNSGTEPLQIRFIFPLANAGTVRDLNAVVGGEKLTEPDERGQYVWVGKLAPGESKNAEVDYASTGARSWSYAMGSFRRRVDEFQLDAAANGQVKFMRGSLEPTARTGNSVSWRLSNVVTNQQVAISFPKGGEGSETFLQAVSMLAASLAIFAIGIFGVAMLFRVPISGGKLTLALAIFAVGLGLGPVLSNYVGQLPGLLIGPLVGAIVAGVMLSPRFLLASVPAALLPAAFLSPEHTGMFVLLIGVATCVAAVFVAKAAGTQVKLETFMDRRPG